MQIITTIPEDSIPAWQRRVEQYNEGSGVPAVSIEGFAQINRDVETSQYIAANKAAMAANEQLMALEAAVMTQPEKLAAVEAAVKTILKIQ